MNQIKYCVTLTMVDEREGDFSIKSFYHVPHLLLLRILLDLRCYISDGTVPVKAGTSRSKRSKHLHLPSGSAAKRSSAATGRGNG